MDCLLISNSGNCSEKSNSIDNIVLILNWSWNDSCTSPRRKDMMRSVLDLPLLRMSAVTWLPVVRSIVCPVQVLPQAWAVVMIGYSSNRDEDCVKPGIKRISGGQGLANQWLPKIAMKPVKAAASVTTCGD